MKQKKKKPTIVIPKLDPSLITKKKNSTIIKEGQDKPKAKKSAHYVDNEKFFLSVVTYQQEVARANEQGVQPPRIPEYIGECFVKICTRISTLHYFSQYTYREDMVAEAIETCVRKVHMFNPQKTANPFSYFTQIAYYSFLSTIATEKEESYVKYKSIIERLSSADINQSHEDANELAEHSLDNVELQIDYLEKFVGEYEKKNKIKPHKTRKVVKKTAIADMFADEKE